MGPLRWRTIRLRAIHTGSPVVCVFDGGLQSTSNTSWVGSCCRYRSLDTDCCPFEEVDLDDFHNSVEGSLQRSSMQVPRVGF